MIVSKLCCTCEHWHRCDEFLGKCDHCGSDRLDEAVCEDWTPMHGEWISQDLCNPGINEIVICRHRSFGLVTCQYNGSRYVNLHTGAIHGPGNVEWWLRLPEVPNDSV